MAEGDEWEEVFRKRTLSSASVLDCIWSRVSITVLGCSW